MSLYKRSTTAYDARSAPFVMKVLMALDPRLTRLRGMSIDEYHPEELLRELGCVVHRVTSREAFLRCCAQSTHPRTRFDVVLADAMLTARDGIGVALLYDQSRFVQSSIRGMGVCVPRRLATVMPERSLLINGHAIVYSRYRTHPSGEPNWPGLLTDVCRRLKQCC